MSSERWESKPLDILVVGGGISGLALAYEALDKGRERGRELSIAVRDENDWAGGKIRSVREDGFVLEWGPNGFLDSKPATLDLVRRLGMSDRLLPSDDAARRRFVWSRGALRALPESPGTFLKSRLLSWPAKMRLAFEPFIGRGEDGVDETVASFARRRLGKQALARLLDPMVSGVFAGDPENLSLAAAFPRIAELERDYGSLVRAMRRIGKERRAARARGEAAEKVGPAPGGRLTSFTGGLQELTDGLARALGDRVQLGWRAASVERAGTPEAPIYRVRSTEGEVLEARVLVLATPAYASADLLRGLSPEAAQELADVPYARLAVIALGYEAESFPHPLDGFGFLVPHEEQRPLLGSLWTSSIFPGHRAPDGSVLLRCMIGGARKGELLDLDDDALVAVVRGELEETMGVDIAPKRATVFRHERAIPGYPPGHLARLARLQDNLVSTTPGLLLAGNAYRGIGLNDCVASAGQVGRRAAARALGDDGWQTFLTW